MHFKVSELCRFLTVTVDGLASGPSTMEEIKQTTIKNIYQSFQ